MKVCVCEKHSVAQSIAQILGAATRRDGFYEGNGYAVTWTIGHLCSLLEPHDYSGGWKAWSLSALPMIPAKFDIKLIENEGYKRQYQIIESLFKQADEIINCGDAGQEGELIQRWVMKKANVTCPVKRLWISSLTDDAIREGFKHLQPQEDYDRLYYAGLSRAIGDWILGMNATRLYTLKYAGRGDVLSIGRVQTPTLALIVNRQNEIDTFVPKDTWELRTQYRGVMFISTGDRYDNEDAGLEIVEKIGPELFFITDVTEKKGREMPPRLFDLTALQVECNKKWAWSADKTLKLIQTLYEKKLTTYPRVDTTYLSDDIYPKVPEILRKLTPYSTITAPVLATKIPKSKKIFDNSKVTDHHAIIPTGEYPGGLETDEKKLYHLIALRFIAAFYPDCEFLQTTVLGKVSDIEFKATGKVVTKPGWRKLYEKEEKENDSAESTDSQENILPEFHKGESGTHNPSLAKKTSQPPKPYTEGSLLRAMETAGKNIDDETLREAMKENGIGRPSTRASIIETLFKRKYIRRERKNIVPTDAGKALIATIHDELLKSAKLTGIWENKLRRIERGEYSPATFVRELSEMMNQIVITVLQDRNQQQISTGAASQEKEDTPAPKSKRAPAIRKFDQIPCPVCGKGHIVIGRSAFGCSEFSSGCKTILPFTEYPADLTPSKLAKKLKSKK